MEVLEPEIIAPLLNEYLGAMTDIVFAHGGTVIKIVGDALHVLFGAPAEQLDHASRAVACALDLDKSSQEFCKQWKDKGVTLEGTRLGLNAGSAIVGNFGGGRYFDYTAYGDTVNIAARLEAANKQLGIRICVGESVATRVPGFKGRPIGDLLLRGRREALRAYEPLSEEVYGASGTAAYLGAFAKLEAEDPTATSAFAALLGLHSEDHLVSFHLKRLLNGATGVRIALD